MRVSVRVCECICVCVCVYARVFYCGGGLEGKRKGKKRKGRGEEGKWWS